MIKFMINIMPVSDMSHVLFSIKPSLSRGGSICL